MKLKRLFAGVLAAALCVTCAPSVFADDTSSAAEEKALKAALTVVKSRIDIPEELSVFDYNVDNYNNRNSYSLSWSSGTGDYKNLNVTVSGKVITNYYYWNSSDDYDYGTPSFAKLTNEKLYAKAKAWVKKLNPTVNSSLLVNDSVSASLYGSDTNFSITRVKNGIEVDGDNGSISIDKNTGEIRSFYLNWTPNLTFDSADKAISVSEAEAAYKKNIGLEPYYSIDYDFKNYERTASLCYTNKEEGYIDALTGEKYIPESNYINYYDNGAEMTEDDCDAEDASASGVSFTPAEQAAIDVDESLLTIDEVIAKLVKNKYVPLTADFNTQSSNLNKDTFEDAYYWNLNCYLKDANQYFYANVNAKTGKVMSFSYSNYADRTAKEIVDETADAYAEKALKTLAGTKTFAKYRLKDSTYGVDYNSKKNVAKTYTYNRYENDIKVSGDVIILTVNGYGEITSYSYNYTNIKFPSADGMLTEAKAAKKLFAQQKQTLKYLINSDENGNAYTHLVYDMGGYTMDAFTGDIATYGYHAGVYTYSDISNHWVKDIAEKLASYSIYIGVDGKLNPDKAITAESFNNLVSNIGARYYYAVNEIAEEDTDGGVSAAKSYIKRGEAIKTMLESVYDAKILSLKGIYKNHFSDIKDSNENLGYYLAAEALGILNLSRETDKDTVRPNANLTNAEALELIYNYITIANK